MQTNVEYYDGSAIERCFAGGSCDPNLRKGGIVFGLLRGLNLRGPDPVFVRNPLCLGELTFEAITERHKP